MFLLYFFCLFTLSKRNQLWWLTNLEDILKVDVAGDICLYGQYFGQDSSEDTGRSRTNMYFCPQIFRNTYIVGNIWEA